MIIALVVAVLLGLALRLPVAIALLLPSLLYILLNDSVSFGIALQQVTSGVDSFLLLAVPMFVLMGNVANAAGITDRLFDFARSVLGHLRGSLGYVNVFVSLGFSWMSGAALADAAGLGKLEVPTMVRRGYDEGFAVGITAASSTIGPIMPPSIPAVIYAISAGASLGGMLVAGVVPALVITVALLITVWVMARKWNHLRSKRSTLREVGQQAVRASLALVTPAILLGGILGGYFTPTEAAAIAVGYMLFLGVVHRTLSLSALREILRSTAETTAAIMFIVGAASLFAWIMSLERAPTLLAGILTENINSAWLFLLVVNFALLLLGMVLEPGSVILVLVPVLLPTALAFDIHPLHLGIIVVFNLMIGLLTPPIGLVLFVLKSVTDVPFGTIVRGTSRFLIPLIACLLLLTYVPQLSLWLPTLVGF